MRRSRNRRPEAGKIQQVNIQATTPDPYRALLASKLFWLVGVPVFLMMIGGTCTAAVWVAQSIDDQGDRIVALEAKETNVATLQEDIRELRREISALRNMLANAKAVHFAPVGDKQAMN